jgi:hypothetical protein
MIPYGLGCEAPDTRGTMAGMLADGIRMPFSMNLSLPNEQFLPTQLTRISLRCPIVAGDVQTLDHCVQLLDNVFIHGLLELRTG